jgi:hypothetical protein
MKKSKKKYLILSLLLLVCVPANAYCGEHWANFLKQPDKKALVALEKSISVNAQKCNWGDPNNAIVAPTEKQEFQLFDLIGTGNLSAFQAALLVHKCWDGGDLEDFYRSVGIFFEKQPLVFLRIVKEKAIQDSEIVDMLTMLPLDTVDDIGRKISMVENRIKKLKNISDESLSEITRKGLSSLEKEKDNLYRIAEEIKKK